MCRCPTPRPQSADCERSAPGAAARSRWISANSKWPATLSSARTFYSKKAGMSTAQVAPPATFPPASPPTAVRWVFYFGRKSNNGHQNTRCRHHHGSRHADGSSAGARDPALRSSRQDAHRVVGNDVQGIGLESQSDPGGHDRAARPVQEAPLAGGGTDVLSAPLAVRQALRRAERARGFNRRADSNARRRESRHGPRHRRNDARSTPAERSRRSARADLSPAPRSRDRRQGSPNDGPAGGRQRGRWHERPARERRHPEERGAGLVP